MGAHDAEVDARDAQEKYHQQGEQRIQVEGNGAQKQLEAGEGAALWHIAVYGSGPAGNGGNDAHRCGGGVNDIGQLGTGNLKAVGHRAHHRANGEAVEIVIHKDQAAQAGSGQQSLTLVFDVAGRPVAVSSRTARALHQHDDHAQQHIKNDDVHIHAVHHGGKQGFKGAPGAEVGGEQRAEQHTDKQRAVNFLGNQCQHNGGHGRNQRPECAEHCTFHDTFLLIIRMAS